MTSFETTTFETTILNLLAHFLLWLCMLILFCGALFLLALVIVAAWNLIETGYKDFKEWRAGRND
jgi:hypothetical protein